MTNWLDDQLFSNRTIAANGVALPARPTLNIIGGTLEDDAANGRTVLTLTGGGGGGGAGAVAVVDVSGGPVTLGTTEEAASYLAFVGAVDAQRVVTFATAPDPTGYLCIVGTEPSAGDGSIRIKCPGDSTGVVLANGSVSVVTWTGTSLGALSIASSPVNAEQLRSIDLDTATPDDGDVLTFDAGASKVVWAPPAAPPDTTPAMIVTWVTAPTALGVTPAYTMPGATRIDASPTVPFRLPLAVASTFRTISVIAYQVGTYDFRATLWTAATFGGALSATALELNLPGGDASASDAHTVTVPAGGAIALEIEVSGTGPTAPTGLCVVLSG